MQFTDSRSSGSALHKRHGDRSPPMACSTTACRLAELQAERAFLFRGGRNKPNTSPCKTRHWAPGSAGARFFLIVSSLTPQISAPAVLKDVDSRFTSGDVMRHPLPIEGEAGSRNLEVAQHVLTSCKLLLPQTAAAKCLTLQLSQGLILFKSCTLRVLSLVRKAWSMAK